MSTLGDRIRSEAAIADRPGQLSRLEAIANEVDCLSRGHTDMPDNAGWVMCYRCGRQERASVDAATKESSV